MAALETALAHWLAAATRPGVPPRGGAVAALLGGPIEWELVRATPQPGVAAPGGSGGVTRVAAPAPHPDPHAATAEVRLGALAIEVQASARGVRAIAQRVLGGPAELAAPRPLTEAERAMWCVAIAAALDDAGLGGEVWPVERSPGAARGDVVELVARAPAIGAMTVVVAVPPELLARAAPARPVPPWTFAVPVLVARTWLAPGALGALAVRDVIVVEPVLALVVGDGLVRLDPVGAAPAAVEATVASEYGARPMAMADDARLELTVELGSIRLSLRQLGELAVGQVVSLGRPLAGSFELRAGGRSIGRGELVDVDGEVGVRVVALETDPAQE